MYQLLDSAKQATGLGQSNTEKATQSVSDGAKSFGQGAKEEFNAVCLCDPISITICVVELIPDLFWSKQWSYHWRVCKSHIFEPAARSLTTRSSSRSSPLPVSVRPGPSRLVSLFLMAQSHSVRVPRRSSMLYVHSI
jgi:hypothetical protein